MIKQSGITEDGKKVVQGCFLMFDTKGLPLPILFTMLYKNDMVPDPIDFYETAVEHGWKIKTIFDRLEEAYSDSNFGHKFWLQVQQRLILYINNK